MSWHYRVLRHPDGWLAVHEVHCDEAGQPTSCSTDPVTFGADADEGLEGVTGSLRMALADAERRPILNFTDITAAKRKPS